MRCYRMKEFKTRIVKASQVALLLLVIIIASGVNVFAANDLNQTEVTIIGDSVTQGCASAIRALIPSSVIDVEVSRSMKMGVDIINEYIQKEELSEYVVISLVSNTKKDTNASAIEIIEALPDGHRLIFVTGYGKDFMKPATEFVRELPDIYPFVAVADWAEAIAPSRNLLAADNVHPSSKEAKELYASCILDAIEDSKARPAKGEPSISVLYNDIAINFVQPPIERNGFIFYSLDAVIQAFESCGGYVNNNEASAVFDDKNGNTAEISRQNPRYVINGSALEIDSEMEPFVENETIYVVMEIILENLGLSFEWDSSARTLTIIKELM